uniref:fructose-bisphosphate aldolase n=1 Tax=Pseudictyota dubia TaxID=2749911 RepID=A0A7R9WG71_9STRA|mmetsp:Transcript_48297/g.89553  ORF Transcript_48297/g.89553 Transcript_48297/m.89553 type:complete len:310 (+) Transcript_48297:245-1174(+)
MGNLLAKDEKMTLFDEMMKKAASADGFLAALDQSGGSTPKALKAYGVPDDKFVAGEESMYDMVHEMRTRMITSPAFSGEKVIGAILFENTMDREIEGLPTGQYLWEKKGVVPFIKCDKGLAEEKDGVQLMKPIPGLDELLKKSVSKNMFGTKMRSVIKTANIDGIKAIVDQQFEVGKQIIEAGLCPILEPEVDITSPEKEKIEDILKEELMKGLDALSDTENVMIKLSLPTKVNLYKELIDHPRCVRVVALSGGYSREEANEILAKQEGMIASFSRAMLEGLSYEQSQEDFDKTIAATIDSIYKASKAP